MAKPSEQVHDTFRPRSIGFDSTMPFNSKPATDNFHVDRSRLGVHDEYDPEAPNDWGGKGKTVEVPNSIMDNIRGAMGGLGARSSFKKVEDPRAPTKTEGPTPCCYEPRPEGNPLMRRKGD